MLVDLYVRFLMMFHEKHVHEYKRIDKYERGLVYYRCTGCGEYRDIRGEKDWGHHPTRSDG